MIDTQRQNLNSGEPDPSPKFFPHCTPESLGGTQVSLPYHSTPRKRSFETSQGSTGLWFQRVELSMGSMNKWKSSAFPWEYPLFFVERFTTLPTFLPWVWKDNFRASPAWRKATPLLLFLFSRRSSGNQVIIQRKDSKEATPRVYMRGLN